MKKRVILAVILGVALSVSGAFAQHSKGFGIGLMWQGVGGGAVTFKLPSLPIFWAASFGFASADAPDNGSGWFSLGVQGDYYVVDKSLIPEAKLGWYLGFGGYASYSSWNYDDKDDDKNDGGRADIGLGVRGVVGLSWQPVKVFELFVDYAPSIGAAIHSGTNYSGVNLPVWNFYNAELGFRFWL